MLLSGALVALTSTAALAQGRGHDHRDDRWLPPGQEKKLERRDDWNRGNDDRRDNRYYRGDDDHGDDRYYRGDDDHRDDRYFRGDDDDWREHIRPGWYMDRDAQRLLYPLPWNVEEQLVPPPYGYRYFMLGGRIVLVDGWFRIVNVIAFRF